MNLKKIKDSVSQSYQDFAESLRKDQFKKLMGHEFKIDGGCLVVDGVKKSEKDNFEEILKAFLKENKLMDIEDGCGRVEDSRISEESLSELFSSIEEGKDISLEDDGCTFSIEYEDMPESYLRVARFSINGENLLTLPSPSSENFKNLVTESIRKYTGVKLGNLIK